MSVKIGALLNSLLQKAGIKNDNPALISLLSKAELANAELDGELADALEKNLLTIDSAKANKAVRSTIIAEAMNGVDGEIESFLNELGFDDTVKTTIKGIQGNTNERLRQLKAESKSLLEKATKQQGKGDVEAANKTITELNAKIAEINQAKQAEIETLQTQHSSQIRDIKLQSHLSGIKYPNTEIPTDVNVQTAQILIQRDLAAKGYNLNLNANGQWEIKTKDGTDVFVDNKQVQATDYINAVLAENKFIATNAPNPVPAPVHVPGVDPAPSNNNLVAEIDAQLASLNPQK